MEETEREEIGRVQTGSKHTGREQTGREQTGREVTVRKLRKTGKHSEKFKAKIVTRFCVNLPTSSLRTSFLLILFLYRLYGRGGSLQIWDGYNVYIP